MKTICCHMVVAALALAASDGFAQTAQKPAFEVASVRLSAPGVRGSNVVTTTRVDMVNVPLRSVLLTAFRAKPFQLSAPDWANEVSMPLSTLPQYARRTERHSW